MQKELQWQRNAAEPYTLNPFKTLTKPPYLNHMQEELQRQRDAQLVQVFTLLQSI